MTNFQVRTDLALEARESIGEEECERGIRVEEYCYEEEDVKVTKVMVDTKNAAKAMGKPIGTYVTMEAPAMVEPDEGYHREISDCLAEELLHMLPEKGKEKSILIVGLGNREVTADALGPQVVDHLMITRHLVMEYGTAAYEGEKDSQNQCPGTGSDGKNGNGNGGNCQGSGKGNRTGCGSGN